MVQYDRLERLAGEGHPECSEGSDSPQTEILRCAQDDRLGWRGPLPCYGDEVPCTPIMGEMIWRVQAKLTSWQTYQLALVAGSRDQLH